MDLIPRSQRVLRQALGHQLHAIDHWATTATDRGRVQGAVNDARSGQRVGLDDGPGFDTMLDLVGLCGRGLLVRSIHEGNNGASVTTHLATV